MRLISLKRRNVEEWIHWYILKYINYAPLKVHTTVMCPLWMQFLMSWSGCNISHGLGINQTPFHVWGPLYTTTLPGETDKTFYQMCLSFRRQQCFCGLNTQKNEPTPQSGNLKKAPPSHSRLKGWKHKSVLWAAHAGYPRVRVDVKSMCSTAKQQQTCRIIYISRTFNSPCFGFRLWAILRY